MTRFPLPIFDNVDNKEALHILEKEDDRKNAMFGEHYHTSCVSSTLDQRQARAGRSRESLLMLSRSKGLRN